MPAELKVFEWQEIAPHQFVALQIVFAPTRTEIKSHKVKPMSDGDRTTITNMGLLFRPKGVREAGIEVSLQIQYSGEPLQIIAKDWLVNIDFEPTMVEHYREIYDGRFELAKVDVQQRFLFDLDRLTHEWFIDFCPELRDTKARGMRRVLVQGLVSQLWQRLYKRIWGNHVNPVPREVLREVTGLFKGISRSLGESKPPLSIGTILLQFAAGDLARPVPFTVNDRRYDYFISEPDSAAIFLFAELALEARFLEQDFWSLPLILDLVKMQRYYLARFDSPSELAAYHKPPRKLCAAARAEIDADYARILGRGLSVKTIEGLIIDNISLTAEPRPPAPL